MAREKTGILRKPVVMYYTEKMVDYVQLISEKEKNFSKYMEKIMREIHERYKFTASQLINAYHSYEFKMVNERVKNSEGKFMLFNYPKKFQKTISLTPECYEWLVDFCGEFSRGDLLTAYLVIDRIEDKGGRTEERFDKVRAWVNAYGGEK